MLTISGLNNFYNIYSLHDMYSKAQRVSEIVRSRYSHDPFLGRYLFLMSKDQKMVK